MITLRITIRTYETQQKVTLSNITKHETQQKDIQHNGTQYHNKKARDSAKYNIKLKEDSL